LLLPTQYSQAPAVLQRLLLSLSLLPQSLTGRPAAAAARQPRGQAQQTARYLKQRVSVQRLPQRHAQLSPARRQLLLQSQMQLCLLLLRGQKQRYCCPS
jgi:hypothetical protein